MPELKTLVLSELLSLDDDELGGLNDPCGVMREVCPWLLLIWCNPRFPFDDSGDKINEDGLVVESDGAGGLIGLVCC